MPNNKALVADPPIASFLKSMLIGGGLVNAGHYLRWEEAMLHPKTTQENILEMLVNNGFANLVDGQIVHVSRQEQLNRALRLACECGYVDLVEKLHQEGAEIFGNSELLCVAADFDQLSIAEYLVEHGADINAHSIPFGQTPLMEAAGSASLSVFQYLMSKGADTTAVCENGMTALEWALMGRHSASLPEFSTDERMLANYDTIIELLETNEIAK